MLNIKRTADGVHITRKYVVPTTCHNKVVSWVKSHLIWAPLTLRQRKEYAAAVDNCMSMTRAESLRRHVLKNYLVNNYQRINKQIEKITSEYQAGDGILALSKRYAHPPADLLRLIFTHLGYKGLTTIMNGSQVLPSARDSRELQIARDNDITFDDGSTLQHATEYEVKIAAALRKHGVKFTTQENLVKDQTKRYGAPVSTPDFVFEEPVFVNGHRVYWIDVKDYYYVPGFMTPKLSEQGHKYNKTWGPGALMFRHGYSIPIKDILCI